MKARRFFATVTASAIALVLGAGTAQAQDTPLLSVVDNLLPNINPSVTLACFPSGQVGQGNTFNGTQSSSCNQSATATSQGDGGGGSDGAAAISGYEVVSQTNLLVDAGSPAQTIVPCPAGKKVLGGGFFGNTGDIQIVRSFPQAPDNTAWVVFVINNGQVTGSYDAYAICADAEEA
ncbi:hypothetical protein [Streptomyces sp. NPDC090445]|uniref:hypothetical protein n=1 Tax=Streptomyces sp. NPDC090445 TaxID=3365963 RepID=UPI0038221CFB